MSENQAICGKCKDLPTMLCTFTWPEDCPFTPLLKALPTASEQRIRFATLMLQGDGDMVEEEYPFTEEARKRIPTLGVKQEWHNFVPTRRDKEA